MSTNIRRSLGPIRKRLRTRIEEANTGLQGDVDVNTLRTLRSKLLANIKSHDQVCDKLNMLSNLEADEQVVVDSEIEDSTALSLDANEALHILTEHIDRISSIMDTKKLDHERYKEELEIEKLKLDNDCKKVELDGLTAERSEYGNVKVDNTNMQRVRLPEIPLPTFSGKIVEWQSFWDSFNSTVHSNLRLSKVDKFKYLMAQLEGDARNTLRGFELTESQYDQAIELLKERYDDTEYIIRHHYKILSQIPRSTNETMELRRTVSLLESQIRSLQSMGEIVENNYMISLFKSKLPELFNLRLEENRDSKWTLKMLRNSANKLILAREKSEEPLVDVTTPGFAYSAVGLLSKNTKVKCCFCEKSHWSAECQEFKNVKDRKSRIKGRCFLCLGTSHLYRDCLSKKPCFYCKEKGQHHSSLCVKKFGIPDQEQNGDTAVLGEELNLNQDVIMKTAKILIYNPLSGRKRSIIALMDSGAKRSYLTQEVADILNLKRGPSKVTMLNTFSTNTASRMVTTESSIIVMQKDNSKKLMQVNVCNTITGSLVRQKLDVERYRGIWNHLEMADEIPKRSTRFNVDLLIGNDYYDDFMKSEKIHLSNGLYLINSTLGWIFSGRVMSSNMQTEDETSKEEVVETQTPDKPSTTVAPSGESASERREEAECVDMEHEKSKYKQEDHSGHDHTTDSDETDPLKKLCKKYSNLKACQDSKKADEQTATMSNEGVQDNTQIENGSTSSSIKWITKGFNDLFYGIFSYFMHCVKNLVRVDFISTSATFLHIIGHEQLSTNLTEWYNAIPINWFGFCTILFVLYTWFIWYFINSTRTPTVKVGDKYGKKDDSKVTNTEEEVNVSQKKIDKERNDKEKTQKLLDMERNTNEKLSKENEELKKYIEETKGDKKYIKVLNASIKDHENKLKGKDKEIQKMKLAAQSAKDDLKENKDKYKTLEDKFRYVEKESDSKDDLIAELQDRKKKLEAQLTSKDKDVAEKGELWDDLSERVKVLQEKHWKRIRKRRRKRQKNLKRKERLFKKPY